MQISCVMGVTNSTLAQLGEVGNPGVVIFAENAQSVTLTQSLLDQNINTYLWAIGGLVEIVAS